LGHRSMFPVCACLNFFVQAIRQIFDIQRSHRFLQNSTSMEETIATVKYETDHDGNGCGTTANIRAGHQPEGCQTDRAHDSTQCAGAGRQNDSVKAFWILDFGFSIGRPGAHPFFLPLWVFLFGLCGFVQAQQSGTIPRVGYLSTAGESRNNAPQLELLRQGLRELGYVDGKNIAIEYRTLEGDLSQLSSVMAELVQLNVDVLYVASLTGIRAAKQATRTIPIVMMTTADPVASGLIQSLARPGGNLTGITLMTRDLTGKQLELLKEVLPNASRVGFLLDADSKPASARFLEYESIASDLRLYLQSLPVRRQKPDFAAAFQSASKGRVTALVVVRSSLFSDHRKRIADLAIKYRLPSLHEVGGTVEAGGLMSYSPNTTDSYRRVAVYVDKILKGAKPAHLPVEQPRKFELVINLKTAKQIGLTIPPNVLARADKVIK
jgi:putative tryptophan/tyrosine transport system substrate-binding protein